MIFVTIGSVFPFDRMVRLSDDAAACLPRERFFAQIGDGAYEPRHMEFVRWLNRPEFLDKVQKTDVIVAHAGMGSVITAIEHGKPIVLVPRRHEWGEHTTDHQMATARWLRQHSGVYVCMADEDFGQTLEAARLGGGGETLASRTAPEPLLERIRTFIMDPEAGRPGA